GDLSAIFENCEPSQVVNKSPPAIQIFPSFARHPVSGRLPIWAGASCTSNLSPSKRTKPVGVQAQTSSPDPRTRQEKYCVGSPSSSENTFTLLPVMRINLKSLVRIHRRLPPSSIMERAHTSPRELDCSARIGANSTPSKRKTPLCVPAQRYPSRVCVTE